MNLDYVFGGQDSVKSVWITPDMAMFWLDTYKYKYQRPLLARHVDILALEMINGRFNEQTTISFGKLNGNYSLLDGQHRLSAIVKSNKPMHSIVCVSEKKTEQELAQSYASFDRQRTRGLSDALHVYELSEINKSHSQHAGSGLRFMYSGFRYTALTNFITPLVVSKMLFDWTAHIKKFYECIEGSPNMTILRKGAVVGFALVTFRYAEDIAYEFWRQVAFDDGLKADDPRKTCIRYLYNNKRGGLTQSAPVREIASGINRTWEAYVKGRSLQKVYATAKDNIIISRTPYDSTIDNYGIDLNKYVDMLKI